jgi:hypothetical protein
LAYKRISTIKLSYDYVYRLYFNYNTEVEERGLKVTDSYGAQEWGTCENGNTQRTGK